MKFGHRLHGSITGYDDRGRGTFRLDGTEQATGYALGQGTVAIPFTAEGDEVSATFIKREHGVKIAKLEELKKPSDDRTIAPCSHAGVCGGCLWQHLAYDAQLRLKRDMINRALEGAQHTERITEVIPSHDQLYYRNRMDYAVGWLGQLGLKEYGSWNRYLDLETCLLLNTDVPQILATVRSLMKEHDLEPWDAKFHSGLMRYVVIRDGKNTNQRMITLVVSRFDGLNDTVRRKITELLSPICTTLLIGEQPLITDLSYIKSSIALKGEPWLEEKVNETTYRVAPNSFFQTNTGMAAELQTTVKDFISITPDTRHVLDLYCGLGFFGIYLAKQYPHLHVSGFEIDAEAIELAKHNATINNVAERCTFTSGPAEDISWKDIQTDAIILDPPRAGLHPRVIKTLLEKKPQTIVYVSCNYHRFVEELTQFKTAYHVESIEALDLFPQTPHVELVTKLVRNKVS